MNNSIQRIHLAAFTTLAVLASSASAWAGEGATIIFRSGQTIMLDSGYNEIAAAVKAHTNKRTSEIVSLNIGGNEILLDVSEVVLLCRDSCRTLRLSHQLDPERGAPLPPPAK
jgi:hypothetical protein